MFGNGYTGFSKLVNIAKLSSLKTKAQCRLLQLARFLLHACKIGWLSDAINWWALYSLMSSQQACLGNLGFWGCWVLGWMKITHRSDPADATSYSLCRFLFLDRWPCQLIEYIFSINLKLWFRKCYSDLDSFVGNNNFLKWQITDLCICSQTSVKLFLSPYLK